MEPVVELLVADVLCRRAWLYYPSSGLTLYDAVDSLVYARPSTGGPATLYLGSARAAARDPIRSSGPLGRPASASAARLSSRSATRAARLNFMASLRGMDATNSTDLGTL